MDVTFNAKFIQVNENLFNLVNEIKVMNHNIEKLVQVLEQLNVVSTVNNYSQELFEQKVLNVVRRNL